jgi:arylsulfatase A-like enzyme
VFQGPQEATHTCFVADEIGDYIRRRRAGQPWFAVAGIFAPHDPITPPARFLRLYDPDGLPGPRMTEQQRARHGLSDNDWRLARTHYYGLCSHVDEQVGKMLEVLEETGQADDTLVVFTSDHGDHMGHHGIGGKGAPGYDSCARVPLILRCPGIIPAGARNDSLVELVDLAPTILDACSAECPPFMQGRSLIPLLRGGESALERDSVLMEIGRPDGEQWKSVRTRSFHFAVSNDGDEELYDMQADPHQLRNIAGDAAASELLLSGYRHLSRRVMAARPHVPRLRVSW